MISGINWCNTNTPDWSVAQYFNVFVVMSTVGAEVVDEIKRRYPNSLIIGRLFRGGDLPTPQDAVAEWAEYIDATKLILYQVDNEPDINYPDVSALEYASWWIRVVTLLRKRLDAMWLFPMPSISGIDYIYDCQAAIITSDGVAERGYWQEEWQMEDWNWGRRYQRTRIMFPNKAIHLCEYGNSSDIDPMIKAQQYKKYLQSLPTYIQSAHGFIMAGSTTDWQKFWITVEMAKEMAMTWKEQFPDEFNAWVAAGGDPEEAFEFYLLGLGYITPSRQYLIDMADNLMSHLEELQAGIANLPLE